MRIERICKFVKFLVCVGVRVGCRFYERQTHNAVLYIVTVFAVVQKAHAVAVLRNIRPFLRANLKFCHIPACVPMRRTFNVSELNFICRLVCVNVNGKCGFEQNVFFFPVDFCFEIYAVKVFVNANILNDFGIYKFSLYAQNSALCAVFNNLGTAEIVNLPHFLLIVNRNFPRVVIFRFVLKRLKYVARAF